MPGRTRKVGVTPVLRLGQATHVEGESLRGALEIAVLYEGNQLQQLGIAGVAKHGGAF